MNRMVTQPLGEVCIAKPGNSKIIKGTLPTQNDGTLFPAYSATGQDVFSDGYDFDGDGIVISAVGARCGKCFLASGKWRAIANTHVILPKLDKAIVRFLWYLLNNESFWVKGGAAQPFVKVLDSLKKLIAVPPLTEQERIVKLLDEADELRKLRAQADHRTADLIPALFYEMFGDPIANPKDWPTFLMSDICETTQGVQIPRSEQTERAAPGYKRYLYISDFLHDGSPKFVVDAFQNKEVFEQDLVVANTGSPGRVFLGKPGVLSNNLFKISFDASKILPLYFYHFLSLEAFQDYLKGQMKQGIQSHLGHKTFAAQKLMIPPVLLQKEFSARVSEIRAMQTEQAASRHRLDDLFQSMSHRAFTGAL